MLQTTVSQIIQKTSLIANKAEKIHIRKEELLKIKIKYFFSLRLEWQEECIHIICEISDSVSLKSFITGFSNKMLF